uniref:14-3-3 domain-containing protein n=1 Tax=Panagrolaimus sp. JU765 TaxID=591449 RepID=A0AC34QS21_9BILA
MSSPKKSAADIPAKLKSEISSAKVANAWSALSQSMKRVTQLGNELGSDHVDLLSKSYQNVVDVRRSLLRMYQSIEKKTEGSEKKQQMAKEYREKVQKELEGICKEVIELLDKFLILKTGNLDVKLLYLKMKGDYYRYLAEVATGEDRSGYLLNSQHSYQEAYDTLNDEPVSPKRLGLALNFSVLYYDVLNAPDKACQLAKQAIDNVDASGAELVPDSTLIMELLRDNLKLWTSDTAADDQNAADEMGETGGI